jgi:hypothetical protein
VYFGRGTNVTDKPASKLFSSEAGSNSLPQDVSAVLSIAQLPPVGQGLLIIDASKLHSDTPHSVRLLWTSDQPDAETPT